MLARYINKFMMMKTFKFMWQASRRTGFRNFGGLLKLIDQQPNVLSIREGALVARFSSTMTG